MAEAGPNPPPPPKRVIPEAASVSSSVKQARLTTDLQGCGFQGPGRRCSPRISGKRLQLRTLPGAGDGRALQFLPGPDSPSQNDTLEKANVASAAPPTPPYPTPSHLLPRSRLPRLPRPPPPACPGPRWGPTLRARAPQGPRVWESKVSDQVLTEFLCVIRFTRVIHLSIV